MAALSLSNFFSNWVCPSLDHQHPKSDSLSFQQPQLAASSSSNFAPNFSNSSSSLATNAFNNIEPLVYSTNESSNNYYTPLLPTDMIYSNPLTDNLFSYSPESNYFPNFEDHDYQHDSFCYPKGLKGPEINPCPLSTHDDISSSYLFNGYVQNYPNFVLPDHELNSIPIEANHDQYIAPIAYNDRNKELNVVKKKPNKVLSAQSIAARQRRRKITEKTQELGKLIPDGTKMNTAEMFQAASKYVKFLQSQVSLLQLLGSFQEKKEEEMEIKELKILESPIIQKKLYTEELCLAPKQLLESLASDNEIQSKPFLKDSIDQLLMQNKD